MCATVCDCRPKLAASLHDPESGRLMEVWTTAPGLQVLSRPCSVPDPNPNAVPQSLRSRPDGDPGSTLFTCEVDYGRRTVADAACELSCMYPNIESWLVCSSTAAISWTEATSGRMAPSTRSTQAWPSKPRSVLLPVKCSAPHFLFVTLASPFGGPCVMDMENG